MTFPEFQLQVQTGANWGKEEKQIREEQKRSKSAAWGQGSDSPQGIYMTIPLNCFLDTETPTK